MDAPRVECRTPTPGRTGVKHIPAWKFDLLRGIILDLLATEPRRFTDLADLVGQKIDPETRRKLGSVGWHVTTVKLELEVRGDIRRQPKVAPQMLELG